MNRFAVIAGLGSAALLFGALGCCVFWRTACAFSNRGTCCDRWRRDCGVSCRGGARVVRRSLHLHIRADWTTIDQRVAGSDYERAPGPLRRDCLELCRAFNGGVEWCGVAWACGAVAFGMASAVELCIPVKKIHPALMEIVGRKFSPCIVHLTGRGWLRSALD